LLRLRVDTDLPRRPLPYRRPPTSRSRVRFDTVAAVSERFEGLLTGAARYTGDIDAAGALHLVFVRSTVAHGRIVSVDTGEAATAPGVAAVYRAGDLPVGSRPPLPGSPAFMVQPPLATDLVRYVGEPVVAVVAESLAAALDAAELVEIEYEPMAVVDEPAAAIAPGAPALFPEHGGNVAAEWPLETLGTWQ